MKTEREAFEDKLKRMGKVDDSTFAKNEDGSYQMDIIHFGWKLWQARVPEGYVVVPKEPTERMLDAARRRQWDDLSSPLEDMDILKYKAMLEAQEPAND